MSAQGIGAGSAFLTTGELAIIDDVLTPEQVRADVGRYSSISSRHVHHPGNAMALERLGADLSAMHREQVEMSVRARRFMLHKDGETGIECHNIEAVVPGRSSDKVIIISAHLDSTADRDPSFRPPCDPAPGADDDASGIAGVLGAARAILRLASVSPNGPRAEIRFAFFNAEEQAQLGSRAYAKREAISCTKIEAVYQMDMIGYWKRNAAFEFEVHAGFDRNDPVQVRSLQVADHLAGVCKDNKLPPRPEVYVHRPGKRDPGQDRSDHTSFHWQGFPAVLITQDAFPGHASDKNDEKPNPHFHLREDASKEVNWEYAAAIAGAVTAAAWHRAMRMAS